MEFAKKLFRRDGSITNAETHFPALSIDDLRPVDSYVHTGLKDLASIPYYPLALSTVYDLYNNSDILRMTIDKLVKETFRNGLWIKPKYKAKCTVCGTEFEDTVDKCPVCGNDKFVTADAAERIKIKDWMDEVNLNGQNLKEVLMDIDYDMNLFDNAFVLVRKEYKFDEDGYPVKGEAFEVLRASPLMMNLVMNSEGRYGRDDDGHVIAFCLEHRDEAIRVPIEEYEKEPPKCEKCGKRLVPAYFMAERSGKRMYYAKGEVLHIKKFTHGVGYGYPPAFTLWAKIMILIKMDMFVLWAYHLQRSPYGLLFIRGREEDIARAWKSAKSEAKNNPYSIVPIAVPESLGDKKFVEYLDLSYRADDINFTEYRTEIRKTIGAFFGVSPIMQSDVSTGVGLANEGLQLTVTNRAVEFEQAIFNEKILPWIMKQFGFNDWAVQLVHAEEKDQMARIERELARIKKAKELATMGYKPKMVIRDDGIDFEYEYVGKPIIYEQPYLSRARPSIREYGERVEGEPERGRMSSTDDRYEGEPETPRKKRSDAEGGVI